MDIIIIIVLVLIVMIVAIKKSFSKNNVQINITSSNKTFSNEELQNNLADILKEHNLPQGITNILNENITNEMPFSTYTTKKTNHIVTYTDGKKVSEVKNTTHSTMVPMTNCPNCGAEIKDKFKENCEYCNSILTKKTEI